MTTILLSSAALLVAVVVPYLTFRLALRQDQARRLWEQRCLLYVDLLTEAYAERQQFDLEQADEETRQRMRSYRPDLRLPPLARARLGSRCNAFASAEVNVAFNRLQGHALGASIGRPRHEGDRIVARVRVYTAFEELETAIRRETAADTPARRIGPIRRSVARATLTAGGHP